MAFQAYQEIKYEKPVIQVFYAPGWTESSFRDLLYGIEEEGLPWVIHEQSGQDAVALAFQACQASRLGVGLGVAGGQMALHYEKLDESKPLFAIPADSPTTLQRVLGANAARLVKKLPFKSL